MAAGEDEAQPVVLEALVVLVGGVGGRLVVEPGGELAEQAVEPGTSPEPIDRLEAAGRDEPGARVGRRPVPGPALDRGHEGVLEGLLGEVEVAQQADQGGQDLARLGPVEAVDPLAHFTVYLYDRRGRGASTDTLPYAVEREVDDLAALIAEAGGSAYVYAMSSGSLLALHAAASGLAIPKLALFEPPIEPNETSTARPPSRPSWPRWWPPPGRGGVLPPRDRRAR